MNERNIITRSSNGVSNAGFPIEIYHHH